MNRIPNRTRFAATVFASALLAGCGGSGTDPIADADPTAGNGSGPATGSTGFLSLSVSDARIDNAAKVCIKFDGIELRASDDAAPLVVELDTPRVVNLLAYPGALSETIITSESVPAGQYESIRLYVDASRNNDAGSADSDLTTDACLADDGSYLLTDTGALYSLFIPSGEQSGLKLKGSITIPVNATGNYTAEWDLGRSFIAPPGQAPDAIMKPVVRLVADNAVGTLTGIVADGLVEDTACDPEFSPAVYVFDDGVVPNPIDFPPEDADAEFIPDPEDPVATGLVERVELEGGAMPYQYAIGFLLAGDYEVAFTCDGQTFVPADGVPASIFAGETEIVDFDEPEEVL